MKQLRKNGKPTLRLHKERIRTLSEAQLSEAKGGTILIGTVAALGEAAMAWYDHFSQFYRNN